VKYFWCYRFFVFGFAAFLEDTAPFFCAAAGFFFVAAGRVVPVMIRRETRL
jgi:hypothetical protein